MEASQITVDTPNMAGEGDYDGTGHIEDHSLHKKNDDHYVLDLGWLEVELEISVEPDHPNVQITAVLPRQFHDCSEEELQESHREYYDRCEAVDQDGLPFVSFCFMCEDGKYTIMNNDDNNN